MPKQFISILEANASDESLRRDVTSAIHTHCEGVIVFPSQVAKVVSMARSIPVVALVSFPFGASKPVVKAIEATSCLKEGASMVWFVPQRLRRNNTSCDSLRDETLEIARAVRATRGEALLGIAIDTRLVEDDAQLIAIRKATREGAADSLILVGELRDERFAALNLERDDLLIVQSESPSSTREVACAVRGLSFPR